MSLQISEICFLTFTLGPASALNSMISSGFCTKDRATQSIERVKANSRSLLRERERGYLCVRVSERDSE